ncbi:DUF2752 domain-containing protein, partial [Streptomyces sp. NPDC001177]
MSTVRVGLVMGCGSSVAGSVSGGLPPRARRRGGRGPGCGGLRSAHAFVHGDFLTALQDNAM